MSTSSRTTGWIRVAARFTFALLAAWGILIQGLSARYIWQLTHLPCPPTPAARPGYQSIQIDGGDGLLLRGWWRAPQNGAVILLMGGAGSGRDSQLNEAGFLAAQGYGILTLEQRNCAGGTATLGYREAQDMRNLAAYAAAQPDVHWIGAFGFSAGGVAALLAAAEEPRIRAVAAAGNYVDLWQEINTPARPPFSLEWQIQRSSTLWYHLITGVSAPAVSPIRALPHIPPRPVLIIAGEKEAQNNHSQEQAAAAQAQYWLVPGAGHGEYAQIAPQEYAARISTFFQAARMADLDVK